MRAKKSLGQHFLHSPQIIADIVSSGVVENGDTVLEIGPGEGFLTRALLQTSAHVISIEKDDRLIPKLQKTFTKEISLKQLDLIHADILDIGLPHITNESYKVVANIPYYITGQIIRMFLESDRQPTSMTLLVQKEVAERIVAKDGKESLLSLSIKIFGDPKYIRTVGRGAFSPQPSVDSAIISIENISKEKLGGISEKNFFDILHAGFSHKRKQLLPNLTVIYPKDKLIKALRVCQIDPRVRAEDIPLQSWIKLCNTIRL